MREHSTDFSISLEWLLIRGGIGEPDLLDSQSADERRNFRLFIFLTVPFSVDVGNIDTARSNQLMFRQRVTGRTTTLGFSPSRGHARQHSKK